VLFGVAVESGGNAAAPLAGVAGLVGKMPALFGFYVGFASELLSAARLLREANVR
jgi:hypothetical protein